MAQINCTVKNRYLSVEPAVNITTGSIGSIQCSFTFDAEWEGLVKTALFKATDETIYPVLITEGICTVPNEAMADGCYITFGVMGTKDGNLVIPTGWENLGMETGCYTSIAPPSEDIYLQILNDFNVKTAAVQAAADKVQQSADEIKASLPAIHQDAETAKAKAAEATAAAGEAAQSRDAAQQYKMSAQELAADALSSAQAAAESEDTVTLMQSNVQGLANQVTADKADVSAKAQVVDSQARQVQETADGFPAVADAAKAAVTAEGTKQVGLVSGEGAKQVKAVSDKGAEQVGAVNAAGAAQTANAQAQADRAKTEADRAKSEADRAAAIDSYTKADARQQFANAFVGEKSGMTVTLPDVSDNTLLRRAAVQGKTTEILANPEAEKSPDNIASISGVEPTKVAVCGKNLLQYKYDSNVQTDNGITATRNPDGSITMQGINNGVGQSQIRIAYRNLSLTLKKGTYTLHAGTLPEGVYLFIAPNHKTGTFILPEDTKYDTAYFAIYENTDLSTPVTVYPQLEMGPVATAYEPFTGTDCPLPTIAPLMSLPNGVCDEYDAVTGTETRQVGKMVLDGTGGWSVGSAGIQANTIRFVIQVPLAGNRTTLCSHFKYNTSQSLADDTDWYIYNLAGWALAVNISKATIGYVDSDTNGQIITKFKTYLAAQHAAGTPITVYYELDEPIITQHDPAVIPAVYPMTTVYADNGNVSVEYNRDSNKVIGQMMLDYTEQITALDARIAQLEIGG